MHERARAYDFDKFAWNLRRVPYQLDGAPPIEPHPSLTSAIFVVHGIGTQQWTDTAAALHSGFEDALEEIAEWQAANGKGAKAQPLSDGKLPSPFALDGYWGNYGDLETTFPEDWSSFEEREQKFFSGVWQHRVVSTRGTVLWFLRQQLRLLSFKTLREKKIKFRTWLLYFPLQIVAAAALLVSYSWHPKIISGFLNDVRLYLDPRGTIERAIVQRIDQQVGERFLRLVGLDWEFRPLKERDKLRSSGSPIQFDRVVWVAHSLGTVISYNVLSDLFQLAEELETSGDSDQKIGVARFRGALARFVTLGSPLDKVAFLFPHRLTPWPDKARSKLLSSGEEIHPDGEETIREWWINFYHVFDPVSGALSSKHITRGRPPANIHGRKLLTLPGLAHVSYWTDHKALRFVLGRTYGREVLEDQKLEPWPAWRLALLHAVSYVTWAGLIGGGACAIARYIWNWIAPQLGLG